MAASPTASPAPLSVNVASNFASIAVRLLAGLFISPVIVRSLGADRYGAWALLAQILSYFSLFDFGIRAAVNYWIVHHTARGDSSRARAVVPTAFWLLAPVSTALAIAGIAFSYLVPAFFETGDVPSGEIVVSLSILSVVIAASLPIGCLEGVLTSYQRFDLANLVEVSYLLVSSALLIGVALSGGLLVELSLAQAAAYTIRWATLWRLVKRVAPEVTLSPTKLDKREIKHLARLGGPKLVMDIANAITNRTDLLVAGAFLGLQSAAIYSIGRQLTTQISGANAAITRVFFPRLTGLYSSSKHDELNAVQLSCSNVSACFSLIAAGGVFLFATPFIQLWVGEQFVGGDITMRSDVVAGVLLAGALPNMLQAGQLQVIFASGRWTFLMWVNALEAVINLSLSLALVKPFGLLGIAIGTLVPGVLKAGVLLWHGLRQHGLPLGDWGKIAIIRPLASVLAAVLAAGLLRFAWSATTWLDLILQGALYVSLAGLLAWHWGVTSSNRERIRMRMEKILRRRKVVAGEG